MSTFIAPFQWPQKPSSMGQLSWFFLTSSCKVLVRTSHFPFSKRLWCWLGNVNVIRTFLNKNYWEKKNIVSYLEKANKINNPIACWIVFYKFLTSSKSQWRKAKPDGLAHLNGGAFGEIIIKCHQNIVFPSIPGCTIY